MEQRQWPLLVSVSSLELLDGATCWVGSQGRFELNGAVLQLETSTCGLAASRTRSFDSAARLRSASSLVTQTSEGCIPSSAAATSVKPPHSRLAAGTQLSSPAHSSRTI